MSSPLIQRGILRIAFLLLLILPVLADTFDLEDALHYIPSKAVGVVGFAVYFIISALLLFRLVRNRDWWGLCLPIGGLAEATGFMLRVFIGGPSLRTSLGYFIAMNLLIILPPAAFLAFNYILYGRLVRICVGRQHSYIRPEIVGRVFVISDILTFLVQASGGSLGGQPDTAKAGQYIFLAGIILQAVSYLMFMALVASSQRSILQTKSLSDINPRNETWYKVYKMLYFSSFFILIRSIYRIVEMATGFDGYLMTHEWPFLVFDSIPLAIAIAVYVRCWPGHYVPKESPNSPTAQQLEVLPLGSAATLR